jgi:hypothetical protein
MYPVSAAFLTAVRQAHTATTLVHVIDGATGNPTVVQPVDLEVTIDRTRDVRRTVSGTIADPTGDLTPADADALLAPFGNELRMWRGVMFPAGTEETVPLGVFRLTDFTVNDGAGGVTIDIEGADRALVVQRNRWVDPYVITSGTPVEDAVADLLADRYPDVQTNFPTTGQTTPKVVLDAGAESDPWRDARELFRAAGYELYFDADGIAVATAPPTLDTNPTITYADGADAVLLDLSRQVSTAASVYNGVVAAGEGTELETPVRAEAWDDDPTSPTYRYGPFGQVPLFYTSPLITTASQAQTAADSRLASILGASEQVEWGQIVNPALDAGDVLEITRASAGLDAVRIILDTVSIPLRAAEAMSGAGRRRFL